MADLCIPPELESLFEPKFAQTVCEERDDLAIQYLLALDLVHEAQGELIQAVTVMNLECATTKLRRVEEYRRDMLRELLEHCERHGCSTPEQEDICESVPLRRAC